MKIEIMVSVCDSAEGVKLPLSNTHGQTGMCLQHRLRLCSGKGHAGISPKATSKATRELNGSRHHNLLAALEAEGFKVAWYKAKEAND